MRKKIGPFIIAAMLAVATYSIASEAYEESGAKTALPVTTTVIYTDKGAISLQTEVAATEAAREYGLMNRDTIGKTDGMLFLFAKAAPQVFWMKNTRMKLDIIFVNTDGVIQNIAANAMPGDLKTIPSDGPVAAAIEVAGGQAANQGIEKGDKVQYAMPKQVHVE